LLERVEHAAWDGTGFVDLPVGAVKPLASERVGEVGERFAQLLPFSCRRSRNLRVGGIVRETGGNSKTTTAATTPPPP
jgi:hypothetical protein